MAVVRVMTVTELVCMPVNNLMKALAPPNVFLVERTACDRGSTES